MRIRKLHLKCPYCGKEYEIYRKINSSYAMLICLECGHIAPLYKWLKKDLEVFK